MFKDWEEKSLGTSRKSDRRCFKMLCDVAHAPCVWFVCKGPGFGFGGRSKHLY